MFLFCTNRDYTYTNHDWLKLFIFLFTIFFGWISGGGHDLYIQSNCRSATTNSHSYAISAGGYSRTWLAGTNSFTLDAIEVFYMTDEAYNPCLGVSCPISDCRPENKCELGRCVSTIRPEGYPCDDGNNATMFDACVLGSCIGEKHHTTSTSYNLDELHPGRSYAVQVRAHTSVGSGPLSDTAKFKTNETAPGSPPRNVGAIALSSTSIHLKWDPPIPETQHGPIRGYEVRFFYGCFPI